MRWKRPMVVVINLKGGMVMLGVGMERGLGQMFLWTSLFTWARMALKGVCL
jgi:hypothetical protein